MQNIKIKPGHIIAVIAVLATATIGYVFLRPAKRLHLRKINYNTGDTTISTPFGQVKLNFNQAATKEDIIAENKNYQLGIRKGSRRTKIDNTQLEGINIFLAHKNEKSKLIVEELYIYPTTTTTDYFSK